VELEGDGGERLQVAPGKKVTLKMAIPAALQSTALGSIPLWYFNDTTGKWIEQGSATRQGNNYVGQVGHFSFWNCDAPCPVVYFKLRVQDQSGKPVPYARLQFEAAESGIKTGRTDSTGYAQGWLVQGQALTLKIKDACGNIVYTQTIQPLQTDVDLGTVTATLTGSSILLKGSVNDCSGNPVADGFLNVLVDGLYYRGPVVNGVAAMTINRCAVQATDLQVTAGDYSQAQLGQAVTLPATGSVLDAGTLKACGTNITQFVTFTINGSTYRLVGLPDQISTFADGNVIGMDASFTGNSDDPNFILDLKDVDKPGEFPVAYLEINTGTGIRYHTSNITSVTCTISHFDDVARYFDGSFTGTVVQLGSLQVVPVSGSFKVKMNF